MRRPARVSARPLEVLAAPSGRLSRPEVTYSCREFKECKKLVNFQNKLGGKWLMRCFLTQTKATKYKSYF